jgi:xanthine dehydrogenase accessory factor
MSQEDLLTLAAELRHAGEPFALATVVRCERPTSAKPGAKALIRADGAAVGWVGGACAEPVVVREALQALRDGQPRLIALVGEGGHVPGRTEGVVTYPMTCHSGGTLEIYVEPFLPKPLLALIGHGPVVEVLATLGSAADFSVSVVGTSELGAVVFGPSSSVVVATHGTEDEAALEAVLATEAGYVSLIASRRRAAVVMDSLRRRGLTHQQLGRLKAPAGIDIGAVTPAEIAVSILAEIVQHRRGDKAASAGAADRDASGVTSRADRDAPAATSAESRDPSVATSRRSRAFAAAPGENLDPVCGMSVDAASARYRSDGASGPIYFCCLSCKEAFDREPQRYSADIAR